MITTKLLYILQDERELPYVYNAGDCAICIAGKEIRVPFAGGVKIFVEKSPATAIPTQLPQQNNNNNNNLLEMIERKFQEQNQKIGQLEQKIQQFGQPVMPTVKEAGVNDNQGQSHRNSF